MRSCTDLIPGVSSTTKYQVAPTKLGYMSSPEVLTSESTSSTSRLSFLQTLSAMLTATFDQTCTSRLTFAAPPHPPPNLSNDKLRAIGLETGINLLHDHINFVRLNPIVTDCHHVTADSDEGRKLNVPKLLSEFTGTFSLPPTTPTDTESYGANASGWTHYSVTDSLPYPFGLPGSTILKYTIALRNLPDGFESLVAAAGGVTIYGTMRVIQAAEGRDGEDGFREQGEKGLWLQETTEVRCWVGTAWYIEKTLRESHEQAQERFRAWWEREVRKILSALRARAQASGEAVAAAAAE